MMLECRFAVESELFALGKRWYFSPDFSGRYRIFLAIYRIFPEEKIRYIEGKIQYDHAGPDTICSTSPTCAHDEAIDAHACGVCPLYRTLSVCSAWRRTNMLIGSVHLLQGCSIGARMPVSRKVVLTLAYDLGMLSLF